MWNAYSEAIQNQKISDAKEAAGDAKRDAQNAMMRLRKAELQVEKLLVITEALWQIAKATSNLEDADLKTMVADIAEFRSGEGALTEALKCGGCQRPVPHSKDKCIYCGQQVERGLFDR